MPPGDEQGATPLKFCHRILDTLQAVPVFVKVMGIAGGIIALFGVGTLWQIRQTERRIEAHELIGHTSGEYASIAEHVDLETQILTRELARVMAILAVIALLLAWLMARILVRPIQELVAGTRRVEQGDYRTQIPVRSADEIGDLAAAFNEMTTTLAQKEAARQHLFRRVMAAGEEERKRVARELHDQTGQALTSLIAALHSLEATCPKAAQLRRLAEQTLTEVHDLSVALRPSVLDDVGLVAALQKHCATFAQRHGIEVDCQAVGLDDKRLPAEIETAAYRVVQEALTNAHRHANAKSVSVLLQRKNGGVLVVIEDDGSGFDASQWRTAAMKDDRLGLLGIEERAALCGGTLQVQSRPGAGTSLFIEFRV
jgi:signal transduction histidine kinase